MLRRVTALVMIVTTLAATFEVGFGLAREGEVHHETTVEAVAHASMRASPTGEHGHEDHGAEHVRPDADHEHHDHGTCVDHCTHLHGPAVPAVGLGAVAVNVLAVPAPSEVTFRDDPVASDLFEPPRA